MGGFMGGFMGEFVGEFLCGFVYGAAAFPVIVLTMIALLVALNGEGVTRHPNRGWLWLGGIMLAMIAGILGLAGWVGDHAGRAGITLAVPNVFSRHGASLTWGMVLGVLAGVFTGAPLVFRTASLLARGIGCVRRRLSVVRGGGQRGARSRQRRRRPR